MSTRRGGSMIQSAGNTPEIRSVNVTVLYEPRDGRVVHMHYAIELEGAEPRTPEQQQQSARESAQHLGCNIDGLEVLHVADFEPSAMTYRVDLQTRTLIERASPQQKGLSMPSDSAGSGM